MTAHVPMARVPFAPLDNPRLQHLASAKNRQNGRSSVKQDLSAKSSFTFSKPVTAVKRSLETSVYDDFDSENVDPEMLQSPSKKSKNRSDLGHAFSFAVPTMKTMPPPKNSFSTPLRSSLSTPRTPLTAPAGRSPKRKTHGISNARRISAPFTRIDPPFTTRSTGLPFSLNEALNTPVNIPSKPSAGATIQESMPKNWFFDIHEDTPEEEAHNLMEHSTLTLDLSSDDEGGKAKDNDRGKENTPPEGYDASNASRSTTGFLSTAAPRQIKKTEIIRKKVVVDEMDDGERSPLSDLETEPFFPIGLTKDAHVVVDEPVTAAKNLDLANLLASPTAFTSGTKLSQTAVPAKSSIDETAVTEPHQIKEEIVVFEDDKSSASIETPAASEDTSNIVDSA